MPKYYCDYCDAYLTHDSPNVRKTHFQGRKHRDNVKLYYQKWMEEQAQQLIDATTAAYKAGKIVANPFAAAGAAIPPPVVRPQVAAATVSVAPPPIIMNPLAATVRPPILPIRPILAVPPPNVQPAVRR